MIALLLHRAPHRVPLTQDSDITRTHNPNVSKRGIQSTDDAMNPVERAWLQNQLQINVASPKVYLPRPHAATGARTPDLAGERVEPRGALGGS